MAINSFSFQKVKAGLVEGGEILKKSPTLVVSAWQQAPGIVTVLAGVVMLGAAGAWASLSDQMLVVVTAGVIGGTGYLLGAMPAWRPRKEQAGRIG